MARKPCPTCQRPECHTRDALPQCACGRPIKVSGPVCDDCYSDLAERFSGRDQSVKVASLSRKEHERYAARQREINAILAT